MAFFADVYGYICTKDSSPIPSEFIDQANSTWPIFKNCFSLPLESKSLFYISFACSVKIEIGEAEAWLSPFEFILKKLNFLNAVVCVLHEESDKTIMYSYFNDGEIRKLYSVLSETFIEESIV